MTTRVSNVEFLTVLDPLPLQNIGWQVRVLSERDYTSQVALIDRFISAGFTDEVNATGGGQVAVDPDDNLFTQALPVGETTPLIDQEGIWQFYEDGVWRFDMMFEEAEEDVVVDGVRQTLAVGRGTGCVLEWMKVFPAGMPNPKSFTRQFKNRHPLSVWADLFAEGQAKGFLPFVTLLFNGVKDSAGNLWPTNQTVNVSAGDDMLDLLSSWCDANDYVWKMLPGFRLQVVPLAQGRRLSDKVVFTLWSGQQQHKRKRNRREIATDVYVQSGDKGLTFVNDADARAKWKQRMKWMQAGDAGDAGARSAVANSTLSLSKNEKVSREITVPPDQPGRRIFVDYGLTDWIMVEVPENDSQSGERQVRALTVDIDTDANVTLELTLQSRFESRQEKLQRMLDRLGGSEVDGTGSKITVDQAIAVIGLDDLADVDLTGATNGQAIVLTGGVWKPSSVANPALSTLTDVDTSTAQTNGQVLAWNAAAAKWKPTTPGSGMWQTIVAGAPLTSDTGQWVVGSGTWTYSSTGVEQTNTGLTNAFLRWANPVPISSLVMKVTIRIDANTAGAFGFQFRGPATGSPGSPAMSIWLRKDGFIQWDRFGSGGSSYNTGLGTLPNGDVDFMVVKRGQDYDCYVNGVFKTSITGRDMGDAVNSYVGLEVRSGRARFANASIWRPSLPGE